MRHLNLHEYQSKLLMEQYGCNTQKFKIATSSQEATVAATDLGRIKQGEGGGEISFEG